jgi:hypothetical protein
MILSTNNTNSINNTNDTTNTNEPRLPKHLKDEPHLDASKKDMGKTYRYPVSYPTRSIKRHASASTKNLYMILAPTAYIAAVIASDRNLHLRSWTWRESEDVGVFINEKYINKTPRSNDE